MNLVLRAASPHLFLKHSMTGAHQLCRVGHPRSGLEVKAQLDRWAELEDINTNNLPLDLILLLKLNLLHSFPIPSQIGA
jgi:hypothetical protein